MLIPYEPQKISLAIRSKFASTNVSADIILNAYFGISLQESRWQIASFHGVTGTCVG
jgi:hypothetical protein